MPMAELDCSVLVLWSYCAKQTFQLFGFSVFQWWEYQMKVIPEKSCVLTLISTFLLDFLANVFFFYQD